MINLKIIGGWFTVYLMIFSGTSDANVLHWLSKVQGDAGAVANYNSYIPKISTNGRYLVFGTHASNLVENDTNQSSDIVMHDLQTGENKLISSLSNGDQYFGFTSEISAPTSDGKYVAFKSSSDQLPNSGGLGQDSLYLKDVQNGQLTNLSGYGSSDYFDAYGTFALSDDAQYIYFNTRDYIDPLHTGFDTQMYRKSLFTNVYELIGIAEDGLSIANDDTELVAVSDNGRYVLFKSKATNLTSDVINNADDNLFRRDLTTQTNTLINITPSGQSSIDSVSSYNGDISNTGQVAFRSSQSDLVINDNNNLTDLFYYNNGTIIRINVTAAGNEVTEGYIGDISISGDDSRIVYESDSGFLVNNDTNNTADIFSYNTLTQVNSIVTVNPQNNSANDYSLDPYLDFSGNRMVFVSRASDLSNEPVSGIHTEVFIHQFSSGTFQKSSVPVFNPNTVITNVGTPYSSTDQNWVIINTYSPNITADVVDPDFLYSYLLDRTDNQIQLLGDKAAAIDISPSGRYVMLSSKFFQPGATVDLVVTHLFLLDRTTNQYTQIDEGVVAEANDSGMVVFQTTKGISNVDTNGEYDVYAYYPSTQSISLISLGLDGLASGGLTPSIGGLGNDSWVTFASLSDQLVNDDTNGVNDIFIKNLPNGNISRVSQTSVGLEGDDSSSAPSISNDGRFISFSSDAQNLTNDDYSLATDTQVLYYDRITKEIKLASRNNDGLPLYSDFNDINLSGISDTGRYISYSFTDDAFSLTDFSADEDQSTDLVLYDTQTETGRIVSLDDNGQHVDAPVGYRSRVLEDTSVSPTLVGVLFTARDSAALTGISNHPGHEELFLYQQGGPDISLNIEVFGPGTVAGTSGINCLISCTYEFPLGTDLSLVATPDTGMIFVRWEEDFGGCADDLNPCELIIDRSKTLRAYFVDPNEQIFVNGFE